MEPSELQIRVVNAAKAGDADLVVQLAKANPFIPASVSIEPALLAACEFGQLAVVRACIGELKCNPNCVDKSGRSPLHMSVVRKNNGKIAIAILRFLVASGAKIRKSVLHVCANDFAVFPLIELKADVNAKSVDGMTPLAVAVAAPDRQDVVSELLRAGAEGSSSLLFKANSASVVHDLVRAKADVNARDATEKTPLLYAVMANDKPLARALLEAKADPNLIANGSAKILTLSEQLGAVRDRLMEEEEWNEEVESILNEMQRKVSEMKKKVTSSSNLCTICKTDAKSVVLMPCRHFCVCEQCSNVLQTSSTNPSLNSNNPTPSPQLPSTCPICRTPIADYVSIYM